MDDRIGLRWQYSLYYSSVCARPDLTRQEEATRDFAMNVDIYQAVVRITNTSSLNGGSSLGSGVVVGPAGLVITNNHVIEDANFGTAFGDIAIETIQAVDRMASDARPVELVIRNESYDLAVLRILGPPPPQFIDLLSVPPTNESLIERNVRVLGYPPLGGSTITVSAVS